MYRLARADPNYVYSRIVIDHALQQLKLTLRGTPIFCEIRRLRLIPSAVRWRSSRTYTVTMSMPTKSDLAAVNSQSVCEPVAQQSLRMRENFVHAQLLCCARMKTPIMMILSLPFQGNLGARFPDAG